MTQQFEFSYQECEACTEAKNAIKTETYYAADCPYPILGVSVSLKRKLIFPCDKFNPKEKLMTTEKTFEELKEIPGALIGKYITWTGKKYMVIGDERLATDGTLLCLIISRPSGAFEWAAPKDISEWKEPSKQKVKHYKIFHKCCGDMIAETAYHMSKQAAIDAHAIDEKDIITIEEREFEV